MRRSPLLLSLLGSLAVALALRAEGAAPPPAPSHVRGDVAGWNGDLLEVRTAPGRTTRVRVPEGVPVTRVEEADASAIADGAFVGTTAVPDAGGKLRALEVHVFPEAMRGAGEGTRAWDRGPESSMTNATVSGMGPAAPSAEGSGSSMTNATVAGSTAGAGERTLTLKYAGGEQTVVVPSGTPVVRLSPGDRSLLRPGAHLFALAVPDKDGTLVAQRVTVGLGGVVPPM